MYGRSSHSTSASVWSIVPCLISYANVSKFERRPTFRLESWPNLGQLDILVCVFDKNVMSAVSQFCTLHLPKADEVGVVGKCHDTFAVFFRYGEQRLEDTGYTLAKLRAKVFENELRILLGHGRGRMRGDVVPQGDIVEGKRKRRSVREMRDQHSV
jgi:hypothetical protein